MPLFRYFGWVGGFLIAALLAANWCCSAPIESAPRSDVPLDQKINIRIHTEHKWPERVVFDTTRSTLAQKADAETDIGGSDIPVLAEHQPIDAFAEMAAIPVRPCFRPPCFAGQLRSGARRSRKARRLKSLAYNSAQGPHFPQSASQAARKKLTRSRTKSRQLTAQLFRTLPHQGSHQHRKQNQVHVDLRRSEASLPAEGALGAPRKRVGSIVQDVGDSNRGLIAPGLMNMAA